MIRRQFFAACAAVVLGPSLVKANPAKKLPRFRIERVDIINPDMRSVLNHGAKWRTTPWEGYSQTAWYVQQEQAERTA